MSDLEFENLSQSGDISCESGMYKECVGTSCKCVEGSKTDYLPWILGGVGVIIVGGLAVSAYRAYKGMPEPGVVWAQGTREPARKLVKDYYHFYVEYPATYYFDPPRKDIDREIEKVAGISSSGSGMGAGIRDLSFHFDSLSKAKAAYSRLEKCRELKGIIKLDHKIIMTSWDGRDYRTVRKITV